MRACWQQELPLLTCSPAASCVSQTSCTRASTRSCRSELDLHLRGDALSAALKVHCQVSRGARIERAAALELASCPAPALSSPYTKSPYTAHAPPRSNPPCALVVLLRSLTVLLLPSAIAAGASATAHAAAYGASVLLCLSCLRRRGYHGRRLVRRCRWLSGGSREEALASAVGSREVQRP